MPIPVQNTTRDRGVKSPYALAFVNTPAGAAITGEIKKYACYKDMVTDAQPARLASVANASMDTDYTVPAEHKGGILFQRDLVNGTWIMLYTNQDMTVPATVDWSNILNVPSWVGGVSNNRVRMVGNTYAQPRTTYYSYGDFILVLPDPNTANLGDQIVLEQYRGQGAVCVPYAPGELEKHDVVNIDGSLDTISLYHVTYTYADYKYTTDSSGGMIIDETAPIGHNSFMFICTETELHIRIWRLVASEDIEAALVNVRQDIASHETAADPHHQYIKKMEVRQYIDSMISIGYVLPDATYTKLGGVFMATSTDVTSSRGLNKVANAPLLHDLLAGKANANHTHPVSGLADVNSNASNVVNGQVLVWDSATQTWYPRAMGSAIVYGPASTTSDGIVYLATMSDVTSSVDTARAINPKLLNDVLSGYRRVDSPMAFTELSDVNIASLTDGKIFRVSGSQIIQTDFPVATTAVSGVICIANDSDVVPNTVVNNKAVNPVQVIAVASNLYTKLSAMIASGGYVLHAATVDNLGGVNLITNENFNSVVSDSTVQTQSAVMVNPMQIGSHLRTVSSSVLTSADMMVRNLSSTVMPHITSLSSGLSAVSSTLVEHTSAYTSFSSSVTSNLNANWAHQNLVSNTVSTLSKNVSTFSSSYMSTTSAQSATNSSHLSKITSNTEQITSNWNDHSAIRSSAAAMVDGMLPIRSVILWYGDASELTEGGVMEDWRLCDGTTYGLRSRSNPLTTMSITTPNMANRFAMGAEIGDSAGQYISAGLPNILGTLQTKYPTNGVDSGAFRISNGANTGDDYDHDRTRAVHTFNAASGAVFASTFSESGVIHTSGAYMGNWSGNPYGKANTVQPPAVTFHYVMKVKDNQWEIASTALPIVIPNSRVDAVAGTTSTVYIGAYYMSNSVQTSAGLRYYAPPLPTSGVSLDSATGMITVNTTSMTTEPFTVPIVCSHSTGLCAPSSFQLIVDISGRITLTSSSLLSVVMSSGNSYNIALALARAPYPNATINFVQNRIPAGLQAYLVSSTYTSNTAVTYCLSGVLSEKYSAYEDAVTATCYRCVAASRPISMILGPHMISASQPISAVASASVSSAIVLPVYATNNNIVSCIASGGFPAGVTIQSGSSPVLNIASTVIPGTYSLALTFAAAGCNSATAGATLDVKNWISANPATVSMQANVGQTVSQVIALTATNASSVTAALRSEDPPIAGLSYDSATSKIIYTPVTASYYTTFLDATADGCDDAFVQIELNP